MLDIKLYLNKTSIRRSHSYGDSSVQMEHSGPELIVDCFKVD